MSLLDLALSDSSIVPLTMTCADNSFVLDGKVAPFPSLPSFAAYLVKFLLGRKFQGTWNFAPSDFTGRPRRLPFASL